MEDKELALKINVSSIADHLNCPICMCILSTTHLSFCGHRFCEKCIAECINRRRKCPCCNQELNASMLIKDPQFDFLIETIKREESAAEKSYFDNLIHTAAESVITKDPNDNSELRKLFSPVEEVFKVHLKKSLVLHEKFYQDLKREAQIRQSQIESDLQRSLEEIPSSCETSAEIERLKQESERKILELTDEMEKSARLVSKAYDRYLSEHIPDLSILPVTITVSLLNKSLQLHDISLKPQDSIEDIKREISNQLKEKGENVVSFGDDVKFLYFSPFAKKSLLEMLRIAGDVVEHNFNGHDVALLPSNCQPVLQFSVRPGSAIAVYGMVRFESDLPKVCFSTTFNSDDKKPMDYFRCTSCSFNWICRPCMEVCHKDHEVVPYIVGHQPTWACCYCPKKKKCYIQIASASSSSVW